MSEPNETYRDKIATVDNKGKRIWIFPKMPIGKYYQYRKWVSYTLLVILFFLPFIRHHGEPIMLFDIMNGNYIFFGVHFAPQDVFIFVIGMLLALVFIVLFTVIFGRLFCGWVCPQTIFMEMVFRRIEYWIEGDANAQRKLKASPWTTEKIWKKSLKHTIFILISIIIAHTLLSYIIGSDRVWAIINEPITQNIGGFLAMVAFTIVFYGVFSILREQVCTTICPYGRLQGVMLDEKSLAVAYDFVRGEPRGKLTKNKNAKVDTTAMNTTSEFIGLPVLGDCVDCGLCVQVCPTGIDIRDGIQLECINCTACMDACDEVMRKIKKPEGLIRIDSYEGIIQQKRNIFNRRALAYSFVLIILIGLESYLLLNRSTLDVLLLRTPGQTYIDKGDEYIMNLYNYKFVNKTRQDFEIDLKLEADLPLSYEYVGQQPFLKANKKTEGSLFIKIKKQDLSSYKTDIKVLVYDKNGKLLDKTKSVFLGPFK